MLGGRGMLLSPDCQSVFCRSDSHGPFFLARPNLFRGTTLVQHPRDAASAEMASPAVYQMAYMQSRHDFMVSSDGGAVEQP
jgi:hypothetical protein